AIRARDRLGLRPPPPPLAGALAERARHVRGAPPQPAGALAVRDAAGRGPARLRLPRSPARDRAGGRVLLRRAARRLFRQPRGLRTVPSSRVGGDAPPARRFAGRRRRVSAHRARPIVATTSTTGGTATGGGLLGAGHEYVPVVLRARRPKPRTP